jgi:hypothetical protein
VYVEKCACFYSSSTNKVWCLFLVARDPSKRRVKPTPTVELFPLTIESESEDSDFKLEEDDSDSGSGSSSDSIDESEPESSVELSESEQNSTHVNGSSTAPLSEGVIFLITALIHRSYLISLLFSFLVIKSPGAKVQEPIAPCKVTNYQLVNIFPEICDEVLKQSVFFL